MLLDEQRIARVFREGKNLRMREEFRAAKARRIRTPKDCCVGKLNPQAAVAISPNCARAISRNFFQKNTRFLLTCRQTSLICGEKWSRVVKSGTK